jgi:hypothetical protein
MVTLDAILDEAKNDPFLANATVLDADQFYTIRGPSSPVFRAGLEAALLGSGDLNKVQQLNTNDGLEVIEPVQVGIHGGCWYLRNLTHRGETFPAGEGQYRSSLKRCKPPSNGGKPRHGVGALWFGLMILVIRSVPLDLVDSGGGEGKSGPLTISLTRRRGPIHAQG